MIKGPTIESATEQSATDSFFDGLYFHLVEEALQPDDHFTRLSNRLSSMFTFRTHSKLKQSEVIKVALEIQSRMPTLPQGSFEGVVANQQFSTLDYSLLLNTQKRSLYGVLRATFFF